MVYRSSLLDPRPAALPPCRNYSRGFPHSLQLAVVVLQHLPAGQSSSLAKLIAKWTRLPVHAATDGTRPAAGCVYIPSPDHILTLEDNVFRTRAAEGGGRRPGLDTIDSFFESLAQRKTPRPVVVILSGTGMDGTAGAVRVQQAGGVVIVQDPLTALHDGMPNAVIQRSIHNHVLPVAAIGQQIVVCARPDYVRPEPSARCANDTSEALARIVGVVRQRVGFDLGGYKPAPVLWRIQQRMEARLVWSFDDYALLIEDDPLELETLVREIPIHVTEFFRDAEAWTVLRTEVLAPLVARLESGRTLRVWTPACSTGEEAYSVAMSLDELANESKESFDYQVFATDAAPELVAKASRGLFRPQSLAGVSDARQSRYFYKVDGGHRVKRFLREKLVFVPQDLISDPPFSGLDLVTCRNLFIYLEPETVAELLQVLHDALKEGGFLFLGEGEAHPLKVRGFKAVSAKWNIYRKAGPMEQRRTRMSMRGPVPDHEVLSSTALRAAYEQFEIPSVLIDDQCSVLRIYGDVGGLLRLSAGEPSLNLTDLVPRAWAAPLQHAITQVLTQHEPTVLSNLRAAFLGDVRVGMRLTPLQTSGDASWDRILVAFIRKNDAVDAVDASGSSLLHVDLGVGASVDWKNEARIAREEVDASHEELLALNEELKASNEELSRSNQDLNESNASLRTNIAQLAMQNHVLLSGAVMTMFLDTDLKLRWFTPSMRKVFPLRPTDTGRRIDDLVPIFRDEEFYADIDCVLKASEPREAAISDESGRCFVRKVFPYLSDTGAIIGVAITFADVTVRAHDDAHPFDAR